MFSSLWSYMIRFFLYFIMTFQILHVIASGDNIDDQYAIVVDAGSTGSRAFIFRFYVDNNEEKVNVMRGKKVKLGISSFADHIEDVADYFTPIFLDATNYIPIEYQSKTEIFIKGTAGMRLLPLDVQEKIWDTIAIGVTSTPFKILRENIGTVDGNLEAYCAVIAANFIAERIGTDLRIIDGKEMVGALDMGGASTQLVFHVGTEPGSIVKPDDFWSHSWLNFGVEVIKEKVWEFALNNTLTSVLNELTSNNAEAMKLDYCDSHLVQNPCMFNGHEESFESMWIDTVHSAQCEEDSNKITVLMQGTGDGNQCRDIIRRVLWPGGCEPGGPCALSSDVTHPPLDGLFYGMSVYFFALDCMRHYGVAPLENWPQASIDELEEAAFSFCSMQWGDLLDQHLINRHPTTGLSKLPYRCVEALYITTLLEDGFGFRGTHRGISIAQEVNGLEVEWTLGYALTEIALKRHISSVA